MGAFFPQMDLPVTVLPVRNENISQKGSCLMLQRLLLSRIKPPEQAFGWNLHQHLFGNVQ
jgi:hypothetical protein